MRLQSDDEEDDEEGYIPSSPLGGMALGRDECKEEGGVLVWICAFHHLDRSLQLILLMQGTRIILDSHNVNLYLHFIFFLIVNWLCGGYAIV
jgi:hypothetical protein